MKPTIKKVMAVILAAVIVFSSDMGGSIGKIKVMGAEGSSVAFGNFRLTQGKDALAAKLYDSTTGAIIKTVDVDQSVGIRLMVDSEGDDCHGFKIVLVPYDTARTLEAFSKCEDVYELGHKGSVMYGRVNSSAWSEDYDKYELDMPQAVFDGVGGMDADKPASGVYTLACIYLKEDVTVDNPAAKLIFSAVPVRVNNSKDGGYVSDEYYGYEDVVPYVNLNVDVYVDGVKAEKNDLLVAVYDEFNDCLGAAPCEVQAESHVKIRVTPVNDAYELIYSYSFGEPDGFCYDEVVPENGHVEINIDKPDQNTEICGHVKRETADGEKVAAGASVTVIQKLNGKTISFVTKTDINGEYSQVVYSNVAATVLTGDKYYATQEKELERGEMAPGKVELDVVLQKAADSEDKYTNGIVRIPVSCGGSGYTAVTGLVFDSEGRMADSAEAMLNTEEADDMLTLELPAGDYKIVLFDDSYGASSYIFNYESIGNVLESGEYLELSQTVLEKELYVLDRQDIPVNTRGAVSPISDESYIAAPDSFTDKESFITITGHIECEKGELKVTKLYLIAADKKSSDSYLLSTAKYAKGTLVVDSKVVASAVSDSQYNSITEEIVLDEPLSGAKVFSLKIKPTALSDIDLHIFADVEIDGQVFEKLEVGKAVIKGKPITLEAGSTTASGNVLVRGTVAKDDIVYIFDNGVEVGRVKPDKFLRYETYIKLYKQSDDEKSVHTLNAVTSGYTSEPQTVVYDKNSRVNRGVFMLLNGTVQPKTYVWAPHIELQFEAVYENAEDIEAVTVFVLCSDGTILEFPAKKTQENAGLSELSEVAVSRFITEKYPFGEKQLVPVKAWAVVDEEEGSTATDKEYNGVIGENSYRPVEGLDAMEWQIGECLSEEYPTEGTLPEGYSGFGYITYETQQEEVTDMAQSGAYHTKIVDGAGNLKYDCYLLLKDGTTTYGYIDYSDVENFGQAYVLKSSLITEKGFSDEIKATYASMNMRARVANADNKNYQRTIGSQIAIAQQQGQMWGKAYNEAAGPLAYDFLLRTLNDSILKDAAESGVVKPGTEGTIKGVPLGDLLAVKSVAESGTQFYNVQNETSTARSELMFYRSLMLNISKSDAVDEKNFNRINAGLDRAISSMDRAESIYKDRFVANVESAIVCKVADFGGTYGKATGAIGGMVGGLMTDDMAVNGEVVLNEARGEYLESQLYIMKAMGITKDDLKELYQDYKDGLTFNSLRKKMVEKSKENQEGTEYEAIIDPSGYVYEAVASNRVSGASVTIYDQNMEAFEAAAYNQQNPLLSGVDGSYAWDVPEGLWYVKVYKEGYEKGSSQNDPAATVAKDGVNYLPVLPLQLDVNIPLTSLSNLSAEVTFTADGWFLIFDKYVMLDTVNDNSLQIYDKGGIALMAEAVDSEVSPAHTPVCGGKMLARTFKITSDGSMDKNTAFSVIISKDLKAYNGKGRGIELKINGGAGIENNTDEKNTPTPKPDKNDDKDHKYDDEEGGSPVVWIILAVVLLLAAGVTTAIILRKKKNKTKA